MRRIVILGISGAGKSTLADRLCADLDLTLVDLDGLHHLAGWTPNPRFVEAVTEALDAAPDGWVVVGNYLGKLGDTVLARADTAIWFDLPRWVPTWRVTRRTVRRLVTREVLWNGNRERLRNLFHPGHPIWWSWSQAEPVRAQIAAALACQPDLEIFRIYTASDVPRVLARTRCRGRFGVPLE